MAIASKNPVVENQYAQSGSFPRYAVKLDTCNNVASGGTYTLSPFTEDMVILEAWVCVTNADSSNGTVDVGLDDDALGTSAGVEVFDEFVLDAGIWEGLVAQDVTGGTVKPVWKPSGSASDSYLVAVPGSAAGTGDGVYNIIVVVAPEAAFE